MKSRHQLTRSAICLGIISVISACSGGSDSSDPEDLTCRAPLVLNSDKTACISEAVNTAPTINSASTLTLNEGTVNGTSVYTASASDAEGDAISWSYPTTKAFSRLMQVPVKLPFKMPLNLLQQT
ncbi:hypothetical protein [Psychrosphaera algicola]|uniref:Uncharacterized protein n=1 Tax=Psychrosphaera algicola TaxID=3023714 RepID=A0ABT5FD47_9GAMM|nr:hypothetical protein [Psychrosphaera sp. G1-22]MDC2888857.1 hypothetical protein [Psychrosphaera sp. G1-22]